RDESRRRAEGHVVRADAARGRAADHGTAVEADPEARRLILLRRAGRHRGVLTAVALRARRRRALMQRARLTGACDHTAPGPHSAESSALAPALSFIFLLLRSSMIRGRSRILIGFWRNASAPDSRQGTSRSSTQLNSTTSVASKRGCLRRSFETEWPCRPGVITASSATSRWYSLALVSASVPSSACATSYPVNASISVIISAVSGSSSATRM